MTEQEGLKKAAELFEKNYHEKPQRSFMSYGRLEIIGNHTDHQHGHCIVAGCSLGIKGAVSSSQDGLISIASEGYGRFSFPYNDLDMGFYSIRLLYLYPDEITDELLECVHSSHSIKHYFDIPIQCASDHLLKLMKRHGTAQEEKELFRKIKSLMSDAVLRTTLIAGFPGESEEDQKETLSFLKEVQFDHLGVFPYSREEGTAAYNYPHQIAKATKLKRRDEIMDLQRKISHERNMSHVGETMEGLVTGYDKEKNYYTLRSYWNAPDDIDGNLYFSSQIPLKMGQIVHVKITSCFIYDLLGERVD